MADTPLTSRLRSGTNKSAGKSEAINFKPAVANLNEGDKSKEPSISSIGTVFLPFSIFSVFWFFLLGGLHFIPSSDEWLREELRDYFGSVFMYMSYLFVFDILFARITHARWLSIHAVGNAIVVCLSTADTLKTFSNPAASVDGLGSLQAILCVLAIHLYHLMAFPCTAEDYFHHFVFAGVLCPLGLLIKIGPVMNAVSFFICGLPGGMDYVMLVLVKHGYMDSLTEKRYNARINVWIRSPGLLFCAFCAWTASLSPDRPPSIPLVIGAILVAFNGQYYMQMVVGNTFIKTHKGSHPYNC